MTLPLTMNEALKWLSPFSFLFKSCGYGDSCLVTMLQCLVTRSQCLVTMNKALKWLSPQFLFKSYGYGDLCLVTMNKVLKWLSPQFLFKSCGYRDLCQSDDFAPHNEAIKWCSSPSVLMQKSFWWVRYSVRSSSLPLER